MAGFGASEVLPSANDYRAWWTNTGANLPYRTNIFAVLATTSTVTHINNQLLACTSNWVVLLTNGVFPNLSGQIKITRSGITLRAMTNVFGWSATLLDWGGNNSDTDGLLNIAKAGYPDFPNNTGMSSVNVNSGLSKGSVSIVVASAPTSFTAGQMFMIDAQEDGTHVKASGSTQGVGVHARSVGGVKRPLIQFFHCTNVSGTTIQFEPPIATDYFADAGIDPEMVWWDDNYSETVSFSSMEDIAISRTASTGNNNNNIHMGPAYRCEYRNIISTNVPNNGGNARLYVTLNCSVRDCLLTKHDSVGSATYGVDLGLSSMFAVVNNIMPEVPCAVGLRGCSAGVIFGNYTTNFPYSDPGWMPEAMMTHGTHNFAILFESNKTPKVDLDYIHGDASYVTIHRNRLYGWEKFKTNSCAPVEMDAAQQNMAVIGNVLGEDTFHVNYESSAPRIFSIDADSSGSMTRKGNYNTVNDAVPAGESMGTDTNAYSYAVAAKPDWWGDRGWPWVVATSTSTSLDPVQATNLPAGFRFLWGSNVPSASQEGGGGGSGPTFTTQLNGGAGLTIRGGVTVR